MSLVMALLLLQSTTSNALTSSPLLSTVNAASQIPDGQVQAPASAPTDSTSWWATLPGKTVISSGSYENPFTIYTSMTNSLGVITGMPAVVTSQPAVWTSQPVSPTLPSYSGFAYSNGTTTSSSSVGVPTPTTSDMGPSTMATSTVTPTQGFAATTSGSATFAQATGGAISNKLAGAGVGLLVAALGFSLL